jgi:DNA mismatch endonuclease (patch repair protein)
MSRVSPSSHEASLRMAKVRQKGTSPEIGLRKALHAKGLRYRLHVPLLTKPRRVADIVRASAAARSSIRSMEPAPPPIRCS